MNFADSYGSTTLTQISDWFNAVIANNLVTIDSFINKGFDLNVADDDGQTALMWASLVGNTEVVEHLINAGVEVNVADNDGQTALIWASFGGNSTIVEKLIICRCRYEYNG